MGDSRGRGVGVVLKVLGLVAATCILLSCSKQTGPAHGGLMLIVSKEGSLPVGRLDIDIQSQKGVLLSHSYKVPEEADLPTSIALVSNGDATLQAIVAVTGWQVRPAMADVPLDRRDAIVTQIPNDRVAELRVVLTAKCSKWVDGEGLPTCSPAGYTCDFTSGECVPPEIDATVLPTFQSGDDQPEAGVSESGAGGEGSNAAGGPSSAQGGHDNSHGGSGAAGASVGTGGAGGKGAGGAGAGTGGSGADSCAIGAAMFGSGETNPANACLVCDPAASASKWTNAANGSSCGSGKVCSSGACLAGCYVGDAFHASGMGAPGNPICERCDPAASTSAWTASLDGTGCGSAQVCSAGVCKAGCFVDAAFSTPGQGKPGNTICASCQPASSTSTWTASSEGLACGANQLCHNGACASGCLIGSAFYAPGAVNGCQTCQPDKSTTAWTDADGMACGASGTCCSNTCVNAQTSNAHCGGCGLACPTGCTAGECVVQACSSLGSAGSFLAIGLDTKNAYLTHTNGGGAGLTWVSLDGNCTPGSDSNNGAWESVNSISVTSSGVAYSLLGPPYPTAEMHYIVPGKGSTIKVGAMKAPSVPITSDASNVYWLDFASGAGNVVKAPISGAGPVTPLAAIAGAGGIAVDATYVYWADSSTVKRVPIAGGAASTLVSNVGSPGFLAVDATNLYWTGVSSALFRLPLGTSTSTTLMNSGATLSYAAVGPSTFYWSTGTTINSISLTGGAVGSSSASPVKLLYTTPPNHSMVTLGVQGRSLYWVDSTTGTLWKMTPN
jgi:hypothetical protein